MHVAHFFLVAMDSQEPLPLMMYSFFEEEFDQPFYVHDMDMAALELYEIIPRHNRRRGDVISLARHALR